MTLHCNKMILKKPGRAVSMNRFQRWWKRYTASVSFDQRLAEYDIQGSLAHAQMLAEQGIISAADLTAIQQGMQQIRDEIRNHQFVWLQELEDVHLNIEKRLTALVGDAGKRLHTGRSRNDQVATDIRLFLRTAIDEIISLIKAMQHALLNLAEQHIHTIMPGFTHLQVAQPVSFGHHLMAYFEMLKRDVERLADCRKRVNQLPLGAAALAGTSYPINRERVAQLLDFEAVCQNSLDAVSDRDFAIEFSACAALIMTHLSRMSEEFILWMNPAFGFIQLADRFLYRFVDHAAEKKSGRAGAGARQNRTCQRPSGSTIDANESATTSVQQG
jgi:argininosuccinate lyase